MAPCFRSTISTLQCHNQKCQAERIADQIMQALETSYQSEPMQNQGFLLLHSTGNYPSHDEIDVPINYADYYYLEALHRRATMK